jgi:hypothetical protein
MYGIWALFEKFFKVLSFYLEARILIRIRIKVPSRIRIPLFTLMRIRIRCFTYTAFTGCCFSSKWCERWYTAPPSLHYDPLRLHWECLRPFRYCSILTLHSSSGSILTLLRIRILLWHLCESDPDFPSDAVPNPDTASLKVSEPCESGSATPVSDPHCCCGSSNLSQCGSGSRLYHKHCK